MSAPEPNTRLLAAEASLQQAKANPATFESGRAPLEKAQVALGSARTFYAKGRDADYIHSVRMGESYVALAQAQGGQLEANRKIASLNKDRADVVSEARTRQVNVAEAATADAKAETAKANIATADAEARAAQSKTKGQRTQLRQIRDPCAVGGAHGRAHGWARRGVAADRSHFRDH